MLRYVLLALCISWCSQGYRSNGYFVSTSYPDSRPLELYNQAVHLQRQGEFLMAIDTYLQALQYFPEFPEAHQNLGHLYETQKNFERTKYHHAMSIRHASSAEFNATAIVNLVLLEMRTNVMDLTRLHELSRILVEAEQVSPTSTHVLFQQALLFEKMGQDQLYLNKLQRVVALDDRHSLAYLNIGNYYFRINNFEVATKFYKHSLDRLPGSDVYNRVLVLNNLGQCYRERGLLKDAYTAFTDAQQSLASTLTGNETSLSTNTMYETTAVQSSFINNFSGGKYDGRAVHFWCLNNMYTIQGMRCDWHNFEYLEHRVELFLAPPNPLVSVNEDGSGIYNSTGNYYDRPIKEAYQLSSFKSEGVLLDAYTMSLLRYASREVDRYVCEQSCTILPIYDYPTTNNEFLSVLNSGDIQNKASDVPKLKRKLLSVGYLSHDWRDHPMGRLTATLVTNHHQQQHVLSTYTTGNTAFSPRKTKNSDNDDNIDTNISANNKWKQRVTATSVSYGANDRSSIRQYVQSHSAYFIDLLNIKNDHAAAEIVHAQQFDIVVDLTAHTYNGRIDIVAARPAPIIINYLGFPGTTGCAAFDYSMVQAQIVPPEYASELFTERMLYLPYTYQSNDMLLRVAPPLCAEPSSVRCKRQNKLVQTSPSNHALSDLPIVPKDALFVCSFNANKKMEPNSFRAWMQVLHRVPKAVFILLSVSPDVKETLRNEAIFYGVHPKRLIFIPKREWKEHLIRSAECDLVLDTFVYGAHTTASDVLWMGVPLLSLRGFGSNRMPSRVAASITTALSVPKVENHIEGTSNNYFTGRLYSTEPADLLVVDTIQQYEDTAVRLLQATQTVRTALSNNILHRAVRSAAFDSELMQSSVELAYQAVYEARQILLHRNSMQPLRAHLTRMPHIVLPPSAHSTAHTEKSWERKLTRDLKQCCEIDCADDLFTSVQADRTQVSAVFDACQSKLASDESTQERSTGCSVSDFHALVRRLITAYPALSFLHPEYTIKSPRLNADATSLLSEEAETDLEVAEDDYVIDTADGIQGNADSTVSSFAESNRHSSAEPVDPNCAASLDLQCALYLFSTPSTTFTESSNECSREDFYEQVHACYSVSALLVFDFLFAVQAKSMQSNQCAGEDAMLHFLHSVLFMSNEEPTHGNSHINRESLGHTAVGEEALVQLRRMTSFSTYVSPLWRTLNATQLRDVVIHALLPQYVDVFPRSTVSETSESGEPKELYLQHLRQFRVRVFSSTHMVDTTDNNNKHPTVCRAFLLAHGVSVHDPEEEYKQCEHVLRMLSARLLTDHSVCLQQLPAVSSLTKNKAHSAVGLTPLQRAVLTMVAAFALDPSNERLLNLGTILMDAHMSEIGFFVSSVAVLRMAESLPMSTVALLTSPPLLSAPLKQRPRVVFYCNEYGRGWWPGWGPSSLERPDNQTSAKGMGGSEEAVYYTSVELAKRGYEVVVYAGVTEADHGRVLTYANTENIVDSDGLAARGSVTWLHYDYYNPTTVDLSRCEVFVAWRYAISLGLSTHPRGPHSCNRKYLWLHDLIPGSILPPSFFLHFDNILVQSDFHKSFVLDAFANHARENAIVNLNQVTSHIPIVPNGISNLHSFDGINDPSVFVYGSAPGRGLYLVLSQWGRIKTAIPTATLEVYYGFTESAMKELRTTQGANFDAWFAQMQRYLQQDGVKYFGSVDHETLTAAYARAGFLLYPTTFQETGCITVLRAMACGAIPITSRLYPSVLHTLTAEYDLGPAPLSRVAAQDPLQLTQWLVEQWTPAVIQAHRQAEHLGAYRRRMKEYIQHRYSWAETANTFINLIAT
eukprot:gene10712-12498_t